MKAFRCLPVLALSALAATAAMAQAAAPAAPAKPVVQTTCSDYLALNETVRPKFIYYAVGHGRNGKPEAVFEETAIEKIKPELDQYCSTHLTESAYRKVIASSMASDPTRAAKHK